MPALNPSKLAPFMDPRVGSIFLLGILSGLPWVMIGSALTLWLKEAGISRTNIGLAGLIFGVFAINFLWAPVLDRFQFRRFTKLGSRRTWIACCQVVIIGMCFLIAGFSPQHSAKTIVLLALVIAIASATQDIAIDAFRVDTFSKSEPEKVSAAASAATTGWWTGYAGLGFIPLYLSDHGFSWASLYPLMGLMSLLGCAGLFLGAAPRDQQGEGYAQRRTQYLEHVKQLPLWAKYSLLLLLFTLLCIPAWAISGSPGMMESIRSWPFYLPLIVVIEVALVIATLSMLANTTQHATLLAPNAPWLDTLPAALLANVIAPLEDFFKRNGLRLGLMLLSFIVLFKLGEAFLGRMSVVFYKEIGFTNAQIAFNSKTLTWGITLAAAIPCALLNARLGLVRGLFISGVFMAASNLMFAAIAQIGPDMTWYTAAVIVDGITTTWGSIAFVAFISVLCSHTFSATQYALMASLGSLGRTTIAAFSGQMVDGLDGNWSLFFIITTLMIIPGLLLLLRIKSRLKTILQ